MTTLEPRPSIAVAANQAWNLVNFRAGLIRALLAQGYGVLAVAPPDAEMESRLREMGCDFEPLPVDPSGLSPFRDAATLRAFTSILRRRRPAALLSWTIKPNIYGAIAGRMTGVPVFPNVSGLGTVFIRQTALTWLIRRLYKLAFARAGRVFFQNRDDMAVFVEGGLVRATQAALVPGSGIDPLHFKASSNARVAPRRFLMIARMVADKGVREFISAAQRVRESYPDARFVLLGFLDVANRTAITQAEVEQWVEAGIVEYRTPLADVRPAIDEADIIVLPSYREGLSRVLLEAAAMKRPIVTTQVPGCADVVEDGVNGFLCRARDATSLAEAMLQAARLDDSEWRKMGLAGRRRVVRDFSEAAVIGAYLGALRDAGL